MVIDGVQMTASDSWVWLIFIGIGLLMVLLELIVGVETGLDLVFLGSAFIIGGLVTWPFHSWVLNTDCNPGNLCCLCGFGQKICPQVDCDAKRENQYRYYHRQKGDCFTEYGSPMFMVWLKWAMRNGERERKKASKRVMR